MIAPELVDETATAVALIEASYQLRAAREWEAGRFFSWLAYPFAVGVYRVMDAADSHHYDDWRPALAAIRGGVA